MPDYNSYIRMKKQNEERKPKQKTHPRFFREENQTYKGDYETKIRTHKRKAWLVRGIILLVLLAVLLIVWFLYSGKEYKGIEVVAEIGREESMMSEYCELGDNILRCSRDGAAYISPKGKTIWDLTFEIQNPLIDVCGSYAAIGESGGNKIFVVNETGKQGEIETLLPIRQVEVAAQGMVAVVLEDGTKNWINFYNKEGKLVAENKAPLENKGYPLSISISSDGKKLAVSYLQAQGAGVHTVVAFYNFDEVGYNVTDHLMSSQVYEDVVVPRIVFLTNDVAVAFGDKLCIGYKGSQSPEEIFKLMIEDTVESIFYDKEHFGLVFQNDGSGAQYRMEIYNLKGKQILVRDFEQNYTDIKFVDKEILIFSENEFTVYSLDGVKKYTGSTKSGISEMMGTGKRYRYLLMHQSKWELIELK